MYVCTHVCMYTCMYVHMYVCIYIYILFISKLGITYDSFFFMCSFLKLQLKITIINVFITVKNKSDFSDKKYYNYTTIITIKNIEMSHT